jgi:anti-sigma28 factor (negative regulator of flagellin synthesis)
MQIHGPASVHGAQSITAPHSVRTNSPVDPSPAPQIRDEVQLSDVGTFVSQAHDLPAMRLDRIAELRDAIASGNYLSEERLSGAIDGLLDEFA